MKLKKSLSVEIRCFFKIILFEVHVPLLLKILNNLDLLFEWSFKNINFLRMILIAHHHTSHHILIKLWLILLFLLFKLFSFFQSLFNFIPFRIFGIKSIFVRRFFNLRLYLVKLLLFLFMLGLEDRFSSLLVKIIKQLLSELIRGFGDFH